MVVATTLYKFYITTNPCVMTSVWMPANLYVGYKALDPCSDIAQLRLLCQFTSEVEVTVLPPYMPSAAERADPRLYAANVRALYSKTLALPLVNQSQHEFRWVVARVLAVCACKQCCTIRALSKAGVRVSWDGRRVVAPRGVLDATGRFANLEHKAKAS